MGEQNKEFVGPTPRLIKAEHQLFILTIAKICLKEKHVDLANKALALDLRIKILNSEMCDVYSQDVKVVQALKKQLLPYLKSLFELFRQLLNLYEDNDGEGN